MRRPLSTLEHALLTDALVSAMTDPTLAEGQPVRIRTTTAAYDETAAEKLRAERQERKTANFRKRNP